MATYPCLMSSDLTATPISRDVVVVSGADAVSYLQTQLTQDVAGLAVEASAWSFILAPKSEIEALVRVTRSGAESVILDVEVGHGPDVRKRLDRMLFRMDVSFEEHTWQGTAWRGDGATSIESDAPVVAAYPSAFGAALDELGPGVSPPDHHPSLSAEQLEAVRIVAGWPSEKELADSATPAMTAIVPHTVNFEKGCYTGQEFVARVHYRDAAPPRRLVHFSFDREGNVGVGDPISVDDEVVGVVTSAEPGVGLGYLKRSVETPTSARSGDVSISVRDTNLV